MIDEEIIEGITEAEPEKPEPEERKPARAPKRPKPVPVRVVAREGAAALVEYRARGRLKRATVPAQAVAKGKVPEDVLEAGIPWGEAWEALPFPKVTPEDVADALRRHGIWTAEDVIRNPNAVRAAVQQVQGPIVRVVMQFINERK